MSTPTPAEATIIEGEPLLPTSTNNDVESAETDSTFARRLAEEEFAQVRDERRQREEADAQYARIIRTQQERYRVEARPYYGNSYPYGAWRRHPNPTVVYRESYDEWCCFCWFFW